MMRSGEVPAGISMRAKWTLTPSGTAFGYHVSTTLLTLGTMIPSRTSPDIAFSAARGRTLDDRRTIAPLGAGQPCRRADLPVIASGRDNPMYRSHTAWSWPQ